jgi:hypothetical protein
MKLEFKFSLINIITFAVLAGLCYWLIPLPAAAVWRITLRVLMAVVLFALCFVVVTHRNFIRKK